MINKNIEPETYTGRYAMHKYWSKKPHNIVREFIKEYTEEGDIVLDPFCGSGVTAAEAIDLDRRAMASDLNPVATFISRNTIQPVDIDKLEDTFLEIEKDIKDKILGLYQMDTSYGGSVIPTHTIWNENEPIEIWYQCDNCGKEKREPTAKEKERIKQSSKNGPLYWVPNTVFIQNSRINLKDKKNVRDLFTPRALSGLSIVWNRINQIENNEVRKAFQFAFTGSVHQASKLVFVINRDGKKTVGSWAAGFWTPDECFEINVWRCFKNGFDRLLRGKKEVNQEANIVESYSELVKNDSSCLIKTADAKSMEYIPQNREVDYIFTDPPYGDSQPYFELSLLWGSWLDKELDFENEIIVSDSNERDKNMESYSKDLRVAFQRMSEVLKDSGYASIAFNSIGNDAWDALVEGYTEAGFQLVDVYQFDTSAGSVKQDSRDNALSGDFILTLQNGGNEASTNDATEKEIVDLMWSVIEDEGPQSTHELYNYTIIYMLENDLRNNTGKDLIDIMRVNLRKEDGKWDIES